MKKRDTKTHERVKRRFQFRNTGNMKIFFYINTNAMLLLCLLESR